MNIIKVDCLPLSIFVGYERENDARGVTFDYSAWAEKYGDGVLQLLVQRPGDADPYPVVLTAGENNTAVWLLSATDTAVKGWLEIQLIFTVGSVVAKTAVLPVLVDRSLAAGATPPDPYETWLETLTELAAQILHTTQPPEIRNSYWYIFDPDTGEYINSGVKAEGEDGVGITGAQLNADYTLTLTFSDGTSYTTPSIRGAQGEPGLTPQLSIGTVTTGAAGSSAAVEITGTPEAPVLNFTIPRGNTGEVSEAELQAALLDKADVITDTASGAIASFPDGAAAPVKALTVAVEPVQDLNGYDSPWPAGGGKNKLPTAGLTFGYPSSTQFSNATLRTFTIGTYVTGVTHNNYYQDRVADATVSDNLIKFTTAASAYGLCIPVVGLTVGSQYTISANCTNGVVGLSFYKEDGTYISGDVSTTDYKTMTVPQETYYTLAYFAAVTANQESVFTDIQLELGSSATSFAPYSNECPISGWSSVGIERTGKNLADASAETVKILGSANGYIYNATGSHVIRIEGGKIYTISMKNAQTIFTSTCATFPEVGDPTVDAYTGTAGQAVTSKTIVTSAAAKYLVFHFGSFDYEELMVNEGATAEPYSAFVGNSYNFSLGQTVYGGTLEYDGDGLKFVADRAKYTVSSSSSFGLDEQATNTTRVGFALPDAELVGATERNKFLCNIGAYSSRALGSYAQKGDCSLYALGDVCYFLYHTDKTATFSEARQALIDAGCSVCYYLAEPVIIPLTLDTPIELFEGKNNLWSDAGDVSVEYRADTKLYIEKKITAAIAAALNS